MRPATEWSSVRSNSVNSSLAPLPKGQAKVLPVETHELKRPFVHVSYCEQLTGCRGTAGCYFLSPKNELRMGVELSVQ
jgi:hypothetical protein